MIYRHDLGLVIMYDTAEIAIVRLLRVAKRALKSTLYMWREPIGRNATHTGLGAFPTTLISHYIISYEISVSYLARLYRSRQVH
jgi:hypothetical protein